MNINRHNYEEYFILYMDNELGSDDRRLVEAFVQQHPDLKDELDLLFQYKLIPDTHIVFDGKEDLLKINGDAPVTLSNYDEWLVLYIDNELTTSQTIKVEEFIAANPAVHEEFNLLQRTKLKPEEIVFADKASLYRKEEKVRPIAVRWWRIAAAAVLLLGIGITTAVIVNKKSAGEKGGIVKGNIPEKIIVIETPVENNKKSNNRDNEDIVIDNNKQPLMPDVKQAVNDNVAVKEKNTAVKNKVPFNTPAPIIKEESLLVNNKPNNDLPKPLNNPNINKNAAANNTVANNNIPKELNKEKDALTIPVVTTPNTQSSDIVNASFTNNNDVELEQFNDKKNKNRGLFRKIARTFEKRTSIDPTDDNKLLVAGLAIRLK